MNRRPALLGMAALVAVPAAVLRRAEQRPFTWLATKSGRDWHIRVRSVEGWEWEGIVPDSMFKDGTYSGPAAYAEQLHRWATETYGSWANS